MYRIAKGLRIHCVNKDSWEQLVWIIQREMPKGRCKRIKKPFFNGIRVFATKVSKNRPKIPFPGWNKTYFLYVAENQAVMAIFFLCLSIRQRHSMLNQRSAVTKNNLASGINEPWPPMICLASPDCAHDVRRISKSVETSRTQQTWKSVVH